MWLVFHSAVAIAKMNHPLLHCAHIHCLVSVNVQQMSVSQRVQFFPHGRIWRCAFSWSALPSQVPFCQTVPLLPSVTQLTKCNGILVRGLNLYCHTTNIHPYCHGLMQWNRRSYFWGSPHRCLHMYLHMLLESFIDEQLKAKEIIIFIFIWKSMSCQKWAFLKRIPL